MRLKRIISGGQTGADRAGLEIAKELGLETGGWAPKGYRTEHGADHSLKDFGLYEHTSFSYPPRTRLNVRDSGGTVLFGNMHSPGCRLTIRYCRELLKPHLENPTASELRSWLKHYQIEVLNVAGNRESTNPGVVALTKDTIREAFEGYDKARVL